MSKFDGRQVNYIEGARRNVPGLDSLHRMTAMLLAEDVPTNGRVLVVGAGGGLELKALAEQHPEWSFDGVDPSSDMLELARETTARTADRINLHLGDISAAPAGPFDGAVCLLVFHHISPKSRVSTLHSIRARLQPGSPFILSHVSFSQNEPERSLWIDRHIKFGAMVDMSQERQEAARAAMKENLAILSPEEEKRYLQQAGFTRITQFYHAFSFRGWIAYA
ncbi:class I SAM-dependent methyltransferase [Agrobacterium larrymoorei]|uniref:Class I SAM-dependent methyltransferase n=1 Tax=Agrobacterium larrymoorei TaxID=160699 RepID=A0AAF0HEM8_9HYPH|nr:class I SAM-dependent methyltransferase [Agrobacterium larrymoorei]WHA43265.1 class I SAM-dependent methyltransferase [Agrobacterium larrymoorei]